MLRVLLLELVMSSLAFKQQSMHVMFVGLKFIKLLIQENSLLKLNVQAENAKLIKLKDSQLCKSSQADSSVSKKLRFKNQANKFQQVMCQEQ